jgi:hypothetical protein
LQGLDEDYDDCLPAAAVPFLFHPSPVVRRAAAQAIGHRAGISDVLNLLAPLLLHGSAKVAATALRHVRGNAVPASVLVSPFPPAPRRCGRPAPARQRVLPR